MQQSKRSEFLTCISTFNQSCIPMNIPPHISCINEHLFLYYIHEWAFLPHIYRTFFLIFMVSMNFSSPYFLPQWTLNPPRISYTSQPWISWFSEHFMYQRTFYSLLIGIPGEFRGFCQDADPGLILVQAATLIVISRWSQHFLFSWRTYHIYIQQTFHYTVSR